ncbi:transcription termination/antitermination protein NusG [Natranaerobius thermophilus]|uniref:Transcription termination/antitermination protein NusG n=1 Tax=Natranaerobius thermophilus (strain ATCC BAA-1301 / DSM 18059 / JW/NM-WN-LF) TaxID=457570 RepID=B2A4C5_NATTJ|nr:transcription termination/antitermination protein NusG [Natranaerobius thermophilus]ACB83779.1 transcription antitermination protein nusG [Natranaerobius thermophilus JW/NM-WN-LF]
MEKQWFVVHTYSGYENKVKTNLEKRVASMGMDDKIFRIVVPTETQINIKDGRRQEKEKKVFPGYVIVEMVMDEDSWYVVRNTPGVTGFVGSGAKPVPLNEDEVASIMKQMGYEEPKKEVDLEAGQEVKILEGPFENFSGQIEEVYPDKEKVKVTVSMFGRETPVELDFEQVEKV